MYCKWNMPCCEGSGLHYANMILFNISVLLHWFGLLICFSYIFLQHVFTVFTGVFVLVFKVLTSRMASWATKGSKQDWNILLASYGGINFGHYDATLIHFLFKKK